MFWENFKNNICDFLGIPYLPKEITSSKEKKLLHISDTPTHSYRSLKKLINLVQPECIIHTGDLADDIKLENCTHKKISYKKEVRTLIKILEDTTAKKVYIVPGNHDDVSILSKMVDKCQLITEGTTIKIFNKNIGVSHKFKELPANTSYNLYGHNLHISHEKTTTRYLNGIQGINIIQFPSEKINTIAYPLGTNYNRKLEQSPSLL